MGGSFWRITDGASSRLPRAPRAPKERKCDFEDGWCTWKNNNTSNNHLAWMLGGEYFKTTLLRPNHDHTYGNGTGSYLFLSNFERNTGEKADLIGEVLFSSDSRTQCVEFWYDINGDKDTTLQVLAVDTTDQSRKASLLWTQKGSDKSSWLMGQLAPPQYSRLVFRGAVGPASRQAYIALDDISIHENDRCEMLPQGAEDLDEGGMIYLTGSALPEKSHPVLLTSATVGQQTEASCFSFWYHMFGGDGVELELYLKKSFQSAGAPWKSDKLFSHNDRTTADRWYNVRRTVFIDEARNEFVFALRATRENAHTAVVALGPLEFSHGPCDVVTDSEGYCDFEVDECGWTSDTVWKRGVKLFSYDDPGHHVRSGPVNSGTQSGSTQGRLNPLRTFRDGGSNKKGEGREVNQKDIWLATLHWGIKEGDKKDEKEEREGKKEVGERLTVISLQRVELYRMSEAFTQACLSQETQQGFHCLVGCRGMYILVANFTITCYGDGKPVKAQAQFSVGMPEVFEWNTLNVTLKQATNCQLSLRVTRGYGTNGAIAIGKIRTKSGHRQVPSGAQLMSSWPTSESGASLGTARHRSAIVDAASNSPGTWILGHPGPRPAPWSSSAHACVSPGKTSRSS
ncbi:hypothetical protein HPB51_002920 [Rhipicephalus microplus]|uniref:MAM domain-containing protein n=1 Tax=Rhipicephalus microplus TaxID=6941 RepID=A0A9J6DT49_RHIMP|nr:hypothetical protein HPB51_002920 [Rhipicephalus microplus]